MQVIQANLRHFWVGRWLAKLSLTARLSTKFQQTVLHILTSITKHHCFLVNSTFFYSLPFGFAADLSTSGSIIWSDTIGLMFLGTHLGAAPDHCRSPLHIYVKKKHNKLYEFLRCRYLQPELIQLNVELLPSFFSYVEYGLDEKPYLLLFLHLPGYNL